MLNSALDKIKLCQRNKYQIRIKSAAVAHRETQGKGEKDRVEGGNVPRTPALLFILHAPVFTLKVKAGGYIHLNFFE